MPELVHSTILLFCVCVWYSLYMHDHILFFPQSPCPRQMLDSIQKMRQLLGIFILFLQAIKPVLFTLQGLKAEWLFIFFKKPHWNNKQHVSKKALGTLAITVTVQCKVIPETKPLFSHTYKGKLTISLPRLYILLSTLLAAYFKALGKHVTPDACLVTKIWLFRGCRRLGECVPAPSYSLSSMMRRDSACTLLTLVTMAKDNLSRIPGYLGLPKS